MGVEKGRLERRRAYAAIAVPICAEPVTVLRAAELGDTAAVTIHVGREVGCHTVIGAGLAV